MTTSLSVSEALQLALKYHRANHFTQAEQVYRQVIKEQPQHPEALYGLGILAQQTGEIQTAEKFLSNAVSVQPELFKAWFSLGNVRQAQGQFPEAELAYQQAIDLQPNSAPLYNNLGYTLQQQGKFEKAIVSYQKALEIQPNCVEAQVNLGNALFAQEKLSPDKQAYYATANNQLGLTRLKVQDFKGAEAYYRQAIAMQPDLASAHHNLGVVLQKQGKLKSAVDSYQQALSLKPNYIEAHKNLGDVLQEQEKFEEAANSYRKALKLKPDYAEVYSNLVTVLKKLNSISIWKRFSKIRKVSGVKGLLWDAWKLFWMRFAGLSFLGRIATWLATWFVPPYWGRCHLSYYHPQGYISPKADIYHQNLQFGANVFIGDRVTIYNDRNGGKVELGDRVHLYGDSCIQTGHEGTVKIGADTHIHTRCQLSAYKASIKIGCNVLIATNCAFYPYDHAMMPGKLIHLQPVETKGDITVEDGAWLGYGVTVLSGVRIGKGAVIGAGSVVNQDIPDGAIAVGIPARVVKLRADLALKNQNNKATVSKALHLATGHYQANRLTQAQQVYRQILEIQPNQPDALQGLGLVVEQMGQFSEAQKWFSKLIKVQPHNSEAWFGLGNSRQAQDNLKEAVEAYQEAISLKPDLLQAHYRLGAVLQVQGKNDAALAPYHRALELNPNYSDVYLNLGKIYQDQNNIKEAISAYRQGLKLINPHYAAAIGTHEGCEPEQEVPETPPIPQEEVTVGGHYFPGIPVVADAGDKRPFWSVVVTVYNRIDYLLECLASVLSQWQGEEQMEIIVIDDASQTPVFEVVNSIGKGIIRYYRNPKNLGLPGNWNAGIALTRGQWIHLLHDDDYILPGFYSRLQQSLERCADSIGAAFTGYQNINDKGEVIFRQKIYEDRRGIAKNWLQRIGVGNSLNMPAVVIRREAHEKLGVYHPELIYTSDWELYKRIAAVYDWWYEPEILARYRQHTNNVTSELMLSGKQMTSIRRAIEISESYLPSNLCAEITSKSRRHYFNYCLASTAIPLKTKNFAAALGMLEEALKMDRSSTAVAKLFSWLTKEEATPLRREIASRLISLPL